MSAVVLLSGGQDSCTCLAAACKAYAPSEVQPIMIDYGQRHIVEEQYARRFAELCGALKPILFDMRSYGGMAKSALTDKTIKVSATGGMNNLPSTFTPGRNMMFLTAACSYAVQHDVHSVWTGVCQTDYSGYPDCREDFITAFELTFALAVGRRVYVRTPLMHLTKAGTFRLAEKLGILTAIIEHTMTCYLGDETRNEWGRGCSKCPSCLLRKKGWDEFQKT